MALLSKLAFLQVELDNGSNILAYLPPTKRYNIKFSPGERVKVELNPYDLTKGKITSRLRMK